MAKQEYKELRVAATQLQDYFKKSSRSGLRILTAMLANDLWTDRQAMVVYRTLVAYSIHLKLAAGIDVAKLPVPELTTKVLGKKAEFSKPVKEVSLIFGKSWTPVGFGVVFPFNETMKEEIKQISGKSWVGDNRFWFIPLSSKKELKAFLEKRDFELSKEVSTILDMQEIKSSVEELTEIFSTLD